MFIIHNVAIINDYLLTIQFLKSNFVMTIHLRTVNVISKPG